MNHGFTIISLIVVLVIVLAGGIGYYVYTQKPSESAISETVDKGITIIPKQNSNTTRQSATSETTPKPTINSAASGGAESCIGSLYSSDRANYDFWKNKYTNLHPEFTVRDAVSYCQLSDGTQLVSFSFSRTGPGSGESIGHFAGASIALFDKSNSLVRENYELLAIDSGVPHIYSVANGKVILRSIGKRLTEDFFESIHVYELSLSDLSVKPVLSLQSYFRTQSDGRIAFLYSSPEGPLKYIAWLETNAVKRTVLHIATFKTGDKTWSDAMGRSEESCSYEGGAVSNACLSQVLSSLGAYDIIGPLGTTLSSYDFSLGKIDNSSAELVVRDGARNTVFTLILSLAQSRVLSTR